MKKHLLYLFPILLMTAFVYSNALMNDFVTWDDSSYITFNKDIFQLSFHSVSRIFTTFYTGMYQPLTILFYAFINKLFGLQPQAFHAFSLIFHLLNIVLVYVLIYQISGRREVAALTALLFGIHPINVEAVAWAAAFNNLLFASFFLLSCILYLEYLKNNSSICIYLSLLSFLFSLLSKSTAVTLPFLLFVLDYFYKRKFNLKLIFVKIPFLILTVIFSWLSYKSQSPGSAIIDLSLHYNLFDRFTMLCYSLSLYFIKFILPLNLSAIYYNPYFSQNHFLPALYYVSVFLFFSLYGIIRMIKRNHRKLLIFCLLFFFVTISVSLPFKWFNRSIAADRYAYIPLIGLFFFVSHYIVGLLKYISDNKDLTGFQNLLGLNRNLTPYPVLGEVKGGVESKFVNRKFYIFIVICLISYVSYLTYLSWKRTKVWKNGVVLFTDVIRQYPKVYHAYVARGSLYSAENKFDKALADFNTAFSLSPQFTDDYDAYFQRGVVYLNLNNYQDAIKDFNKSISLRNDNYTTYFYRGYACFSLKKFNDAVDDYSKAIELSPKVDEIYFKRAVAFDSLRKLNYAINDYTYVIRLNSINNKPDMTNQIVLNSFVNRGMDNYMTAQYSNAVNDFRQFKINVSNSVDVNNYLAYAYFELGDFNNSLQCFNASLKLDKNNLNALLGLSIIYFDKHDPGNSKKYLDIVVQHDPNIKDYLNDLSAFEKNGWFLTPKLKITLSGIASEFFH